MQLRHHLAPGDLGAIISLHAEVYSREQGFDERFEAYVASALADLVIRRDARERVWLAERDGRLVGCVAIAAAGDLAQLRWFVVHPDARGSGLGTRLLAEAVAFAKVQGYPGVLLWTVSALAPAARLYRAAGFVKTHEQPGRAWGVEVVEEKYELAFAPGGAPPPAAPA
jgi:GNAT superfamily N-acetyltransferase